MISAIFIFNLRGEVLISRLYRPDAKRSLSDIFRIQVIAHPDVRSPIITLGSTSFFHVRHQNLYVVAVTKCNANAALVFEFLYRLIQIGRSYFGTFDEEAVKNNFILLYELLDEIMDFGIPQNSEIDTLKMYITTASFKSEQAVREDSAKISIQATGAVGWRRSDIKYRKNEVFVDVIETVNMLMSASGTVLRSDVDGQIMMRAYLSGMPECRFGLNDKLMLEKKGGAAASEDGSIVLDDTQFHQCVKLGRYEADRSISFVPPDGEFELMKYRATRGVSLPIKVHALVDEPSKTRVDYNISLRTTFESRLNASSIVLRIPTPLNATSAKVHTSIGKAKYHPSDNMIVWKIARMQGGAEATLQAEAERTSTTTAKAWSRPPIEVDFQILMYTASGLLVRYLKVFERSNYQSVKWVRYLTRANGSYLVRF